MAIRGAIERALRKGNKRVVIDFDSGRLFEGVEDEGRSFGLFTPETLDEISGAVRKMFGVPPNIFRHEFVPGFRYSATIIGPVIDFAATHTVVLTIDRDAKQIIFDITPNGQSGAVPSAAV